MSDSDTLNQIWQELRYVRKRFDDHIDIEDSSMEKMQEDIGKIREEMAGDRVVHKIMNASITIFIAGIVTWVFNIFGMGNNA